MKLNWFSPLPPAQTDIAYYSARLAPLLCSSAEVTLWTDQAAGDRNLEQYCPCRLQTSDLPWSEVNREDASIFHIGNNPNFHLSIWEASCAHAGIVVLHDLYLQDLFYGILTRRPGGRDAYIHLMERLYGPEGREAAMRVLSGTQGLSSLSRPYPLWEAVTENALGVVVHTSAAFEAIAARCECAVAQLALPYPAASPGAFSQWQSQRQTPPRPPFKVVVFGFLGFNRRIDSLLQAFSELDSKNDFRLELYGSVGDENYVRAQIRRWEIQSIVTINGFVPDLDNAIADADLAINLRFPAMGEASGSQLRIWDHALPSIVTRTGWSATLPGDTVLFVDIEREVEDIKRHLRAFCANPAAFAKIGDNGRAILLRDHAPERYIHDLLHFTEQAVSYRPALTFRKTAGILAHDLRAWLDHGALDQATESVAASVATLVT